MAAPGVEWPRRPPFWYATVSTETGQLQSGSNGVVLLPRWRHYVKASLYKTTTAIRDRATTRRALSPSLSAPGR